MSTHTPPQYKLFPAPQVGVQRLRRIVQAQLGGQQGWVSASSPLADHCLTVVSNTPPATLGLQQFAVKGTATLLIAESEQTVHVLGMDTQHNVAYLQQFSVAAWNQQHTAIVHNWQELFPQSAIATTTSLKQTYSTQELPANAMQQAANWLQTSGLYANSQNSFTPTALMWATTAAAAVIGTLLCTLGGWQYLQNQQTYAAYQSAQQDIFEQALPNTPLVNAPRQITMALQNTQRLVAPGAHGNTATETLQAVAGLLAHAEQEFTLSHMAMRQNQFELEGYVTSLREAEAWQQRLGTLSSLSEATLQKADLQNDNRVFVRITAQGASQ